METKINLFPLTVTEERMIMLSRLKSTKIGMAAKCGVSAHHYIQWMKGERDSAPLQAKLEQYYLRICERKS